MPTDASGPMSEGLEGRAARQFHDVTSHRAHGARLDDQYARSMQEELRPRLHKLYPTLEPIPLPRDGARLDMPAIDAIAEPTGNGSPGKRIPDVTTLAQLLLLTDGVTRRIRRGDRVIDFRAAPCTGALYHVELYVICGDLPGLEAGVYHYGTHDHALRRLRAGDYRARLVEASGNEPHLAPAPAIVVTTSVFWRNAWKYLERAYRHTYWDTGTMLPNTLAVAAAGGLPAHLVLSFADQSVADVLGVDIDREGVISMVALGRTDSETPSSPSVDELDLPTEPYSVRELDLPLIRETHQETLLHTGEDAAAWRSQDLDVSPHEPSVVDMIELPSPDETPLPQDSIEEVVRRRGSTRQFAREPIPLDALSTLLHRSTRGIPSDTLGPEGVPLGTAYVIANAVDGLTPGAYVYHPDHHALQLLRREAEDAVRERATFLALEQDLGGDAAVNIYFLADLDPILSTYGDRGYRLAHLGSSLVAGKLYLAAYALRLGATGLTFFDDAVPDFLGPHADGKSVMFLVAIGVPMRANR